MTTPTPAEPVDATAQAIATGIRAYAAGPGEQGLPQEQRMLARKQRSIGMHHIRYAAEDGFFAALAEYREGIPLVASRTPQPPQDQPADEAARGLSDAARAYGRGTDGRDLTPRQRSLGMRHIRYAAAEGFDAALSAYRGQEPNTVHWREIAAAHGMAISSLQSRVQRHRGEIRGNVPGPRKKGARK